MVPNSWQYADVCGVVVRYVADHLDPTGCLLGFGMVALNELRPRVIMGFTLGDVGNGRGKSWAQLLEGETLEVCLMVCVGQLECID